VCDATPTAAELALRATFSPLTTCATPMRAPHAHAMRGSVHRCVVDGGEIRGGRPRVTPWERRCESLVHARVHVGCVCGGGVGVRMRTGDVVRLPEARRCTRNVDATCHVGTAREGGDGMRTGGDSRNEHVSEVWCVCESVAVLHATRTLQTYWGREFA